MKFRVQATLRFAIIEQTRIHATLLGFHYELYTASDTLVLCWTVP